MQICEYKLNEIREIEAFMFHFLWSKNLNAAKAPDRIKRSILKQDYSEGGLKVPDISNLNSSLKLSQFFKACNSNHVIRAIQEWQMESLDYDYVVQQEYARLCELDNVIRTSQETINNITDRARKEYVKQNATQFLVDLLAAIDIKEYLTRKNERMRKCLFQPLFESGIENLKQLINEASFPRSDRFKIIADNILGVFPALWRDLITSTNGDPDVSITNNIALFESKSVSTDKITVKMIRKSILQPPDQNVFTFELKLGINRHPEINPFITNREANKSEQLRMLKYRLLHCDVFCKERMYRFKMVDSENCDFCGVKETIKHQLWDCDRARRLWGFVNNMFDQCGMGPNVEFENLFIGFVPKNITKESIVTKTTQLLLQIQRDNVIENEKIKSELIFLGKMYNSRYDKCEWTKIIDYCL